MKEQNLDQGHIKNKEKQESRRKIIVDNLDSDLPPKDIAILISEDCLRDLTEDTLANNDILQEYTFDLVSEKLLRAKTKLEELGFSVSQLKEDNIITSSLIYASMVNLNSNGLQNNDSQNYDTFSKPKATYTNSILVEKNFEPKKSSKQKTQVSSNISGPYYFKNDSSLYWGEFLNATKYGNGICIFNEDSDLEQYYVYAGRFKDNNFHGAGYLLFKNGSWYNGKFTDGQMHGKGTLYDKLENSKYNGYFVDDKKEGKGKMEFFDKNIRYNGGFIDDDYHGKGTMVFEDGSEYCGQFEIGMFHGEGIMNWPNGKQYNGMWENDMMEGKGTSIFPDGTKYVGAFKANFMHGYGEITYPNDTSYKGEWKNGNKHGSGVVFNDNTLDGIKRDYAYGKLSEIN